MSEPVVVALITAAGAVLVAVLALVGRQTFQITRIRKDAATTVEHVANHHGTNLREEQDHRHAENQRVLASALEKLAYLVASHETLHESVQFLRAYALENRQRIEQVEEDTSPRPRYAPPPRHRREPS